MTRRLTVITYRESKRRLFSAALVAALASGMLGLLLLPDRTAAGEFQPNELKFGSVRVGATVEGSVRIFRDTANANGLAIKVESPAFVRVEDIKLLKHFVEQGGRTIVAANAFFVGTVAKANELLVPYGLQMTDTESRDRHEFEIGAAEITDDALTHGVKALYFHRPSPVAVTDSKRGKILVAAPGFPGQGFVAVAHAGRGEVIALGDSLWWHWAAHDNARGSDGVVLLRNLLEKSQKRK